MKITRILMGMAALGSLAGLAYVAQTTEPVGEKMVAAAKDFLGTLKPAQKEQAVFSFDSKERTNWNFIPLQDKNRKTTRKGLGLGEMTPAQKKAALGLLQASLSDSGAMQAVTIMSLEAILHEAEKGKGNVRDPEWYFFSIFGEPSRSGRWGWRVEGHHLSLNFTMDGAQVVASSPSFFGANPSEIKSGKNKGLRVLAGSEDLAFKLFGTLNDDQKQTAHQDKAFPEPQQKSKAPKLGPAVGLPAAKMTAAQKEVLRKLLHHYTDRMPAAVAKVEWDLLEKAGFEKIHFAFTGKAKRGVPHTYRVQGPTFVIEYLNTQPDGLGNPASHIHSAWRRIEGDFGL